MSREVPLQANPAATTRPPGVGVTGPRSGLALRSMPSCNAASTGPPASLRPLSPLPASASLGTRFGWPWKDRTCPAQCKPGTRCSGVRSICLALSRNLATPCRDRGGWLATLLHTMPLLQGCHVLRVRLPTSRLIPPRPPHDLAQVRLAPPFIRLQ